MKRWLGREAQAADLVTPERTGVGPHVEVQGKDEKRDSTRDTPFHSACAAFQTAHRWGFSRISAPTLGFAVAPGLVLPALVDFLAQLAKLRSRRVELSRS